MWQQGTCIIIGLVMIAVSLLYAGTGHLIPFLLWTFAGGGAAVSILSCWGLYDELIHEQAAKGSGLR